MKKTASYSLHFVLAFAALSCASRTAGERFVLQKIPIAIEAGKSTQLNLRTTGENDVGICCPSQVWAVLTNGAGNISVHLVSSDKKDSSVQGVSPGAGKMWPIECFYYLFRIYGVYGAHLVVSVTFAKAPPGITHAEIIVCKHPADLGL